jgi:hypothetical protein
MNLSNPLFQEYRHCVTRIFPNRLADVCPYTQFMCAVTQQAPEGGFQVRSAVTA